MATSNLNWPVVDYSGKKVGEVTLNQAMFGAEEHSDSVHLVVRTDLANRRQATAKTKVRSEVSGGGKKPWRQKGTGRARAGSTRSPIWVGGGTVFGPDGRQNYKLKVNKQVHALAVASVLSDKVRTNDLIVLSETAKFQSAKTKEFVKTLKDLKAKKKVLIVVSDYDENLVLAMKNVPNISLVSQDNVSVYDVLNADTLIISESLVKESEAN